MIQCCLVSRGGYVPILPAKEENEHVSISEQRSVNKAVTGLLGERSAYMRAFLISEDFYKFQGRFSSQMCRRDFSARFMNRVQCEDRTVRVIREMLTGVVWTFGLYVLDDHVM